MSKIPKQYGLPVPRIRSRGGLTASLPIINTAVQGPSGGENFVKTWYTTRLGDTTVMADRVTPGFNRRRAEGEVLFNPMNSVRENLSFAGVAGWKIEQVEDNINKGQTYEVDSNWFLAVLGGLYATPQTGDMHLHAISLGDLPVDRAVLEAATQARRTPSDANLLVTLAELHKTMRLVPDLLNSWSSLFQKLNRAAVATRNKTAFQNAKGISASNLRALERHLTETWLAMRFGVRPLIMDTLGLLKAIKRVYTDEPVRLTSRGQAHVESSSVVNGTGASPPIVDTYTSSTINTLSVRAMQLWEMKLTLANQSGLSITQVPEAAIDLVRFSFVLNWVVNVNDFFASLGSFLNPGMKDLGGCYVVNRLNTTTWQSTGTTSTNASYVVRRQTAGIITATTEAKYRVVGLPAPKLVVRADPSRFLTDFRLVDAIALLRQQTRGRNVRLMRTLPGI